MNLALKRSLLTICAILTTWLGTAAQDKVRELKVEAGSRVEIVNRAGRVAVKAEAGTDEKPVEPGVTASSPKGVTDTDIKITGGGTTIIVVTRSDIEKRIDLVVTLPERCKVKVQTVAGAIEIAGNFASVEAETTTGTIVTDVPVDELKYSFLWTESKPRYLADFDIEEVKEKSGGRFEIRGRKGEEQGKSKKAKGKTAGDEEQAETRAEASVPVEESKSKKGKGKNDGLVELRFTTARGIILLNVPPSEVMADLRERPLTEAAKAIVRSGDSLLTEAIRRASPKYFGDYMRAMPPIKREPSFATRSASIEVPNASIKTASVRITDLKNRAIDGLRASDFEVTEGGVSREVVSVTRSTAPVNLVLLLDVSGSVENYVTFIRKAARNFVETVDERDRVSIVIFNEDIKKLADFTTDKTALSKSLDSFDAGGGTAYYDALAYVIADTLRPLKGERSAVVILTDGDDNRSFLAFDSLAGSIQESGALVYPLYVPSGLIAAAATGAAIDPMRMKYMSLTAKSEGEGERLAAISGGVYYPITQIGQIQKAYDDIVQQMRSAYLVTFRSDTAASGNGVSPRLKIRSKRENTFATVTSVVAAQ